MPEPPYGIIWNRLKAGRVVPFLGAGASFVGRAAGVEWTAKDGSFLPSGLELAHFLAEEAGFPAREPQERGDLAKVTSYYVDVSSRSVLRERLREVLHPPYHGGPLHEFLAAIQIPLVIVVTNYDTLLEQTFRIAGKPYDLITYPTDQKANAASVLWWPHGATQPETSKPNSLDIDLTTTTVIFKMHGSIVPENHLWDSFVITEEDYVEFLSRMMDNKAIPACLVEYFKERSFLFLGYSLRDWNLRVVLKNLSNKRLAKRNNDDQVPSWAIQHNPSELERQLWDKRKVKIYDIALDDFIVRLRGQMET
jgi:SIR2-like domain